MSQMNTTQARVIDPILSEVARGYPGQGAAGADVLFPIVYVGQRAGRIISFGPDDFKLITTARAPGASTKRVQFGYSSEKYALIDYRLEGSVPVELQEEATAVPGIDLQSGAVRTVQNQMALEREAQAAKLARDTSKYAAGNTITLSGTDLWTDPASNPFELVMDGKETVRGGTGVRPNVLALAPRPLTAMRTHPKVLDRLSTASDRPPATLQQLQALFEVENVVELPAVYHDEGKFKDLWGTDVVMAYTTPKSLREMGSPSFGYTYRLRDRPMVEEGYYDPNTNTWYYPVQDAYDAVLAGPSAGYLIKNAVAPA